MMRWLDGLGGFKWPSLLLIASPMAAYPFWVPPNAPAVRCGRVAIDRQTFDIYRSGVTGEFILRPSGVAPAARRTVEIGEPFGFDAGGMKVPAQDLRRISPSCFSQH